MACKLPCWGRLQEAAAETKTGWFKGQPNTDRPALTGLQSEQHSTVDSHNLVMPQGSQHRSVHSITLPHTKTYSECWGAVADHSAMKSSTPIVLGRPKCCTEAITVTVTVTWFRT